MRTLFAAVTLATLVAVPASAQEDEAPWTLARCQQALGGDDAQERAGALRALTRLGAFDGALRADAATAALLVGLLDEEGRPIEERALAARALGLAGAAGASGVPALQRWIVHDGLRRACGEALELLPHTPAQARALEALLGHGDRELRARGASLLGFAGKADPERAVGALLPALGDAEERVRASVALALDRLGGGEVVDAALGELAGTERSSQVLRVVLRALEGRGALSQEAVVSLAKNLHHRDRSVCSAAASLLGKQGAAAVAPLVEALGVLRQASFGGARARGKTDRPSVRRDVIKALGAIGVEAAAAAPDLVHGIREGEATDTHHPPPPRWLRVIRHAAWEELPKLGGAAVEPLVELLEGQELLLQLRTVETLARFGAEVRAAREPLADALIPLLTHPDRALRGHAARLSVHLRGATTRLMIAAREARLAEVYPEVRVALDLAVGALSGELPDDWEARLEEATTSKGEQEAWRLSKSEAGPKAPHFELRPGRAKLFEVDPWVPSTLNRELLRDGSALGAALQPLRWLPPDAPSLREYLWFSNLHPDVPVRSLEGMGYVHAWMRRRLVEVPLSALEAHLGEELYLGDLLQTDGYRGTETFMVVERPTAAGEWVLRVVDPYRVEYYCTPPSYLTYPDVVPSLSFWDEYQVECVPLSTEWAREQLKDGLELKIEGVAYAVTAEQAAKLKDPNLAERLYAHPGAGAVYFLKPADVDMAAPLNE